MKDPVLKKLKADAGIVLNVIFLVVSHRKDQPTWRHPRDNPPAPEMAMLKPVAPSQSGLCYFHLN